MAAVAAASESDEAAARAPTPAACCFPRALLDPLLLMAALRGDSKLLKGLLHISEEDTNPVRSGAILETNNGVRTNEGDLLLQVGDNEIQVLDDDQSSPSPSSASRDDDAPPPPTTTTTVEPLDEDGVTREGDSLLHVVAASGDTQEYLDCAKMIVRHKKRKGGAGAARLALEERNNKGDTPLHCAAGAGNADMITCVTDLVADAADDDEAVKKAFWRMQNEVGETALHQAVRAASASNKDTSCSFKNKDTSCIDRLMPMDSELACIPRDDEDGASPVYLAISLGEVEIAQHLYTKSEGKLSYSGPDGRNVLHAAVSCGQEEALRMVLGWLSASSADKQQQLTSQRDDENGSTPLHLAASLPGLPSPSFIFMYKTHPHFWGWSGSPATLLLEANESTAYEPDKEGLYPIHVAAGAGSLRVVSALLERCPECAILRDAKGRTFLHIAVEEGRYSVVRYVCDQRQRRPPENPSVVLLLASIVNCVARYVCCRRQRKQNPVAAAGLLSSILNAQDVNGDTPLHRAVHAGNRRIFFCLVRNLRARLDVQNNKGMRPIDVSWSKMPLSNYYAWDPSLHIRRYLLRVGAPYGENRDDRFHQRHILSKQDEEKMSADLTASAQVLCLFSVLITTVTFASAFTLPGGYRSAGDAGGVAGTPVLAGRSYAFDAFVLSDTLAFMCSLYATSRLLYAGVPCGTLEGRFDDLSAAYTLMWHAGRSLVAAFGLGLYIVLLPVARTIAIVVPVLMAIIALWFLKASEGINSMLVIGSLPVSPACEAAIRVGMFLLDYFWSYMIIFGVPAIREWARLP